MFDSFSLDGLYELFTQMNFWGWMTLAFMWIAIELVTANTVTLWLAVSAALVALLKLIHPIPKGWDWILFGVLSCVMVLLMKKMISTKSGEIDRLDVLNPRGLEYVGNVLILSAPIENQRGRILLDGMWWRIEGPDCEAGHKIRIVGLEGTALRVEQID